jgi:N-acetylglutamate synthase-like GNAT family acetyltransferase
MHSTNYIYEDIKNGIKVRTGLKPGDQGYITYLHGIIYHEEHNLDITFESYVANPLNEFALKKDNPRERIWILEKRGKICGCVAIVEHDQRNAQLRWLILTPEVRGKGLGRILVEWALGFCKKHGYRSVFLWTFNELEAAAHIYVTNGFRLTDEKTHIIWGKTITEQRYELNLK